MSDRVVWWDFGEKSILAARIWLWAARINIGLRRHPLPPYVTRIGSMSGNRSKGSRTPQQMSRAVDKTLTVGTLGPRCLVRALVLYRLLKEQGDNPEIVVGLSESPNDHKAHAWVELDGVDVGPKPGRHGHEELARFS